MGLQQVGPIVKKISVRYTFLNKIKKNSLRDKSPDAFTKVIEHYMGTTNYNELGGEDQQFVIDMNKYYKSLLEKGDEMVAGELHQLQTDLEKNKQLLIDIGNAMQKEIRNGVTYDKQYKLIQMREKTKQNIAGIEREIEI